MQQHFYAVPPAIKGIPMNIRDHARGHWPQIWQAAGISPALLDGHHHPCPHCGGDNRFRIDTKPGKFADPSRGTWYCNQCGGKDRAGGDGDGFNLLERVLNLDYAGTARFIEGVLGVESTAKPKTSAKPSKTFIKTAAQAVELWPQLPPAQADHPYLTRKGIKPYQARQNGDELIIPVYSDLDGTLATVQKILPEKIFYKNKRVDKFFPGGQGSKTGNFYLFGSIQNGKDRPLLFCEGFATGATLHEATGHVVVVCFDKGNMANVAEKLRSKTDAFFVFCADNDPPNEKTGIKAGENGAKKAIKRVGGVMCLPEFPDGGTGDFNDLAAQCGQDAVAEQVAAVATPANDKEPEAQRFILHGGQLKAYRDKDGDGNYITIGAALEVVAATRDERGNNHGRLLRFPVRHGKPREWVMPMRYLASDTTKLAGVLMDMGYWFPQSHLKTRRDMLCEYLGGESPGTVLTTTDQTGWRGETFVLTGGELIGDGEQVVFTGAETDIYAPKGTLAGWRQNVAALAVGNSRLLFAISLAFAGPLMPKTGDDGAGVNFYGETSTGKTTTQRAAASIWGSPDPGGFTSKWNSSPTGLELQAVQRNHTLFVIDELGEVEPKIAGRLIYQLASGVQKGRGRAGDSGVGLADLRTWKMPFISSAEKTVMQHVEEAGQRLYGGQVVRCVDITADAGEGFGVFEELHGHAGGAELSDHIKAVTRQHHGTAGRAFVEALLKMGVTPALDFIQDKRDVFIQAFLPANAGGVVKRAIKLFSLSAAAGELAVHLGILPWDKGAATQAAGICFEVWLAENGTGNPDERAALAQVEAFIETNMENFRGLSENSVDNGGRAIPNQKGYVDNNREIFYLYTTVFEKEACKNYLAKNVIKWLKARDALIYTGKRNVREIKKPGARYAYAVNLEKLSAESAESEENGKKYLINNTGTFPHSVRTPSALSPLGQNSAQSFGEDGATGSAEKVRKIAESADGVRKAKSSNDAGFEADSALSALSAQKFHGIFIEEKKNMANAYAESMEGDQP